LEELRRRKYGLRPSELPKLSFYEESTSMSPSEDATISYVVDESDFKLREKKLPKEKELDFTLTETKRIVMKDVLPNETSLPTPPPTPPPPPPPSPPPAPVPKETSSMPPISGRESSMSMSSASVKPRFVLRHKESSADRFKVNLRMSKYWNSRVRQDFSPKVDSRKKDDLELRMYAMNTTYVKKQRFHLVRLDNLI
jgi:hypothetical protein